MKKGRKYSRNTRCSNIDYILATNDTCKKTDWDLSTKYPEHSFKDFVGIA